MALSLPSLPRLPTRLPGASMTPVAVLNGLSLLARALPQLNPPFPIYALLNSETGLPLAIPDTWGEVLIRWAEYQTTEYPVQDGGFITANKVRKPNSVDIVWIKAGSDLERATWLEAIRQQFATDTLATYHLITPNGVFQNLTLTMGAHQTRPDRGQNLLYVELRGVEVPRIAGPSVLGALAVEPESIPLVDSGRVYANDTPLQVRILAGVGP